MTENHEHPGAADVERLLDLALLQGNRFIKELLRERQLPIGTNKEEFEVHLREAITGGALSEQDIRVWLADVEGWGDQHVFPYTVPRSQRDSVADRTELARLLRAAELEAYLDAELPGEPQEDLALASIRHNAEGISFVWVRGTPTLLRRSSLDYDAVIDGEDIEFHAYERRWTRVAARFEWRFATDLAGVFLSRRSEDRDYARQRDAVLETVDAVLPARARWRGLDIARAIVTMDELGLSPDGGDGGAGGVGVRMSSTVFQGSSASVRLASTSEAASYQDDAGIRQVRRAVDPALLVGGSSDCYLTGDGQQSRELHIRLYGSEQRLLLWGKMSSEEAWGVLLELSAHAGG